MWNEEKKKTALASSVGTDEGQSILINTTQIIPEQAEENNPSQEEMYVLLRKINQLNDPHYLHTISLNELFESVYEG